MSQVVEEEGFRAGSHRLGRCLDMSVQCYDCRKKFKTLKDTESTPCVKEEMPDVSRCCQVSSLSLTRTACQKSSGVSRSSTKAGNCKRKVKKHLSRLWFYNIHVVFLAIAMLYFISTRWKNLSLSSYIAGLISLTVVIAVFSFFFLSIIFLLFIPDDDQSSQTITPHSAHSCQPVSQGIGRMIREEKIDRKAFEILASEQVLFYHIGNLYDALTREMAHLQISADCRVRTFSDPESTRGPMLVLECRVKNMSYSALFDIWKRLSLKLFEHTPKDIRKRIALTMGPT